MRMLPQNEVSRMLNIQPSNLSRGKHRGTHIHRHVMRIDGRARVFYRQDDVIKLYEELKEIRHPDKEVPLAELTDPLDIARRKMRDAKSEQRRIETRHNLITMLWNRARAQYGYREFEGRYEVWAGGTLCASCPSLEEAKAYVELQLEKPVPKHPFFQV